MKTHYSIIEIEIHHVVATTEAKLEKDSSLGHIVQIPTPDNALAQERLVGAKCLKTQTLYWKCVQKSQVLR